MKTIALSFSHHCIKLEKLFTVSDAILLGYKEGKNNGKRYEKLENRTTHGKFEF